MKWRNKVTPKSKRNSMQISRGSKNHGKSLHRIIQLTNYSEIGWYMVQKCWKRPKRPFLLTTLLNIYLPIRVFLGKRDNNLQNKSFLREKSSAKNGRISSKTSIWGHSTFNSIQPQVKDKVEYQPVLIFQSLP